MNLIKYELEGTDELARHDVLQIYVQLAFCLLLVYKKWKVLNKKKKGKKSIFEVNAIFSLRFCR